MVDNFKVFADAVNNQLTKMTDESLFVVDSERNAVWEHYLSAFPDGSDPIFRERTEHDCSCCRHFVRQIGHVVSIKGNKVTSVWDVTGLPEPYQTVVSALSTYVKSLPVRNIFLSQEARFGNKQSIAMIDDTTYRFNHFYGDVPNKFVTSRVDEKCGAARTTHSVLMRGFKELTPEALTTVAELIADGSLYRGDEHSQVVAEFIKMQKKFSAMKGERDQELFAWTLANHPVARFRNTVIGTLAQDLSSGVDLETAVRAFEFKVAPQNYKRPTTLITKAMVQAAVDKIAELGLEQALERRHARLSDVSVNSVLFVDNSVSGEMKDGIKSLLMEEVRLPKFDPSHFEKIDIHDFIADVLPRSRAIFLYLENNLTGNLVSLTAPVHGGEGKLFKWDNDFAWSYEGNVADSIKNKVKRAGGRVENVTMRVSLAWFNTDDLDLHVIEPGNNHIYYGNKCSKLDVDMNVSRPVRDAVENVRWTDRLEDGIYKVEVDNYTRRENIDVGFVIEVEGDGGLHSFTYDKRVSGGRVHVCSITVKDGHITKITPGPDIIAGKTSQEVWGLKTLDMIRVNSLVISPNYWGDTGVGNKHWFFILEGCKNPEPTRGIYNEFLNPALEPHRKVFEILGDKTKCPVVDDQLSGVGFSSTRRDEVSVMVSGPNFDKSYTIQF